jgi:hypothetical protein
MEVQEIHNSGSDDMGPKPGYKAPSRDGKVSILIHLDEDVRMAFKVATIENGTTMQDAIVAFITDYAGPVIKRMKRKP